MIHCYEFYASPVISKPRYFDFFFHFPWDFEIAGFNCISNSFQYEQKSRTTVEVVHNGRHVEMEMFLWSGDQINVHCHGIIGNWSPMEIGVQWNTFFGPPINNNKLFSYSLTNRKLVPAVESIYCQWIHWSIMELFPRATNRRQ